MSRRVGLLVVNRADLLRRAEEHGSLMKRVPPGYETNEEVFRKYRGFDGLAWPELEHVEFPTEDGLADLADLERVNAYARGLCRADECEVIALARMEVGVDTSAPTDWPALADWHFAGFDLGYFEAEWSHFSVVLNEIIYAVHPELHRLATTLNEHLLIPTLGEAVDVIAARARVAAAGGDVEEAEHIGPIAIFRRGGSSA